MKALVVRQPWASLIAHGVKTIETRGFAPRTSLRPGDPLAIVAGKTAAPEGWRASPGRRGPTIYGDLGGEWVVSEGCLLELCDGQTLTMPLGAVVAVVTYDEALPCVQDPTPDGKVLHPRCLFTDNTLRLFTEAWDFIVGAYAPAHTAAPLTDELPIGDFTPGRYGWLLSNPQRLTEPVPCPAKRPDGTRTVMQGVFTLPDDVLEKVLPQIAEVER